MFKELETAAYLADALIAQHLQEDVQGFKMEIQEHYWDERDINRLHAGQSY